MDSITPACSLTISRVTSAIRKRYPTAHSAIDRTVVDTGSSGHVLEIREARRHANHTWFGTSHRPS